MGALSSWGVTLVSWHLLLGVSSSRAFFANFSPVIASPDQSTCNTIPPNMTLCQNIGYPKMKLPNLLGHESMHEAIGQSNSWLPLRDIHCHPSSRLFLCSLFAPVCLPTPVSIYPCRSLCESVRSGCERIMMQHGFPWPSILECDKFPLDNDMCISARAGLDPVGPPEEPAEPADEACPSQVCASDIRNEEDLMDLYCQSDFVIKMKTKRVRDNLIFGKRVKHVYKTWRGTPKEMKLLRKPILKMRSEDECCTQKMARNKTYLVMGYYQNDALVVSFIHRWSKSKGFKKLRRRFKKMSCN